MRFAGSVTLRPIRLGFLVPPDDFALVRRVVRLCSCLWGGRYNPMIPFFEDVRPRWIAPYQRAEGPDVARGYIDFFEPDVLVEAKAGMAARLGWSDREVHFRLPRVVPLETFYEVDDRGRVEFAAGIDVVNVMQHLFDQEYQYQRRHKTPYASVEAAGDDAFFDVFPGAFPEDAPLEYIANTYRDVFEPEVLQHSAATSLRMINEGFLGPLWISRHGLEEGLGRGQSDPTVFIFDPSDPGDVIDYWNYRLVRRQVLPISVKWLPEHAALLRDRIEKEHRPIPGNPFGTMFHSKIDFGKSIADQVAKDLLAEHFTGLAEGAFYCGRGPDIWPATGSNDRWRDARILIKAETDSFDVQTTADDYAKIPSLAPEFHNSARTYTRAHWMNVVAPTSSRLNQDAAIVYPSNLWNPGEPGFSISRELTITREGWTVPQEHDIGYALLRPANGRDALIGWFKANGIEAVPSEEGQVAAQIIAGAGSLFACGMFADPDTLALLNEMAESHAEPTRDGRPVRAISPDRAKHVRRIQQHFEQREKRTFGFWNKLDYFLERSVFRAGLKVQCPTCAHHNWFDLDAIGYALICNRCLKPFNFAQAPADLRRAEWFYRVIGPFAAADYGRGGYAVALTLRCLAENRQNELTWSTGLILQELKREIDFAAWYRRGSFGGGEREEPVLIIGEAKSFGKNAISADDLAGLRQVAERFPNAILVVSSLRPIANYSAAEIERLSELARWGRSGGSRGRPRNPLIVLTETELFSEHGIAHAWKKTGGRAAKLVEHAVVDLSDLYQLAEATQRLYLNLPSFHEDYGVRLKAQRRQLLQLIRARPAP